MDSRLIPGVCEGKLGTASAQCHLYHIFKTLLNLNSALDPESDLLFLAKELYYVSCLITAEG